MDAFGVQDVKCIKCFQTAEFFHLKGISVSEEEHVVGVTLGFYCKNHWIEELKNRTEDEKRS